MSAVSHGKKSADRTSKEDLRYVDLNELMPTLIKEWNITEKSDLVPTGGQIYSAYVKNL